ncbi:meiotically up-regulated gene 71 protein [Nannochloropsis oceanica]
MKFVALVSGGKDSVFSIAKCLAHDHELVALANLYPPPEGPEELDSFMFQSAGAAAIECLAECMDVPLVRAPMSGHSGHQGLHYTPTEGDEVEDLYSLLARVQHQFPDVQAVASGAVLSTYQRTRVESVCERLGLRSLAFLWRYDQTKLLQEMVEYGLEAVIVKVSSQGLSPHKHLGKSIAELRPLFARLHAQHGFHVAGEGGEYETLTLNAPFFRKRLVLDETEVVIHADDVYTPVGLLHIHRCHIEAKDVGEDIRGAVRKVDGLLISPAGGQRLQDLSAQAHAKEEESTIAERNVRGRSRPRHIRPLPHIWRQGKQLNISGLCVPTTRSQPSQTSKPHQRAADQMRHCLESLQAGLALHGLTLHDVVFVHLYLRSMSSFAAINAVYCQMPFHALHPPSRSCVELPFPQPFDSEDGRGGRGGGGGVEVLLDCMALAGSGAAMDTGRFQTRQVLHVKSLSGWAPLCIGPYSQANMLAHGHLLFLAGAIGLAPSTMTLVTPPSLEASQALCNCAAVLHALRSSLRTAVMVMVYVSVGMEGEREGGTGWSSAAVAEWKTMCRLDAGYQKADKDEDNSNTKRNNSVSRSNCSSSDSDDEDEEDRFLETFPAPVFLPVGVPGLPRGAAIEFEVMALSTAFAREQMLIKSTERGRPMPVRMEEKGGCCPFPLPFQPAATYQKAGDEISSSSSSLSYAWEALHLPYVLSLLSLSLLIDDDQEDEEQETGVAASSCSCLLLDYSHVALTMVQQIEKVLQLANLTWRQLSHLRIFYAVDQLENEQSLREALAAALPDEGQCARTFLPVSCLAATDEEVEGTTLLFRVQAVALDLEKLRTEAWIHDVPDGGI